MDPKKKKKVIIVSIISFVALAGAVTGAIYIFKPKEKAGSGSGSGSTEDEKVEPTMLELAIARLKTITETVKNTGKFNTLTDLEFYLKNYDHVPVADRLSKLELIKIMETANVAYFGGVLKPRWTEAQAENVISSILPYGRSQLGATVLRQGTSLWKPFLAPYGIVWGNDDTAMVSETSPLKEMLAHGWWPAYVKIPQPYSAAAFAAGKTQYKADGQISGYYVSKGAWVVKMNKLSSPNPDYVTIPIPNEIKSSEFSSFSGKINKILRKIY